MQQDGRGAYLLSAGFVGGHVTLQLSAVVEGIAAERAGEALLLLLMPIFDVFLQRGNPFVTAVAVRTGKQLGEVIRCVVQQVCMQQSVHQQSALSFTRINQVRETNLLLLQKEKRVFFSFQLRKKCLLYRFHFHPAPPPQGCPVGSVLLGLLGK